MREEGGAGLGGRAPCGTAQTPSHTCTHPQPEAAGLAGVVPNVCSHGSVAFLYCGHAGGTSRGGQAQPAVLCSPPSCSACFLAKNVTAALPYLMLGFLILSHVGVLSSKSERYEELFWFGFCFSDVASHLPGAIRVLPRHGRTMFPKPKSSWHHVQRNKTHPRLLARHEPPRSCSGKRLSP